MKGSPNDPFNPGFVQKMYLAYVSVRLGFRPLIGVMGAKLQHGALRRNPTMLKYGV